jgi:DNA-binding NarL/FixJ family response regulator
MKKIRILLIEDNRLLREGIATMLHAHLEFRVVAASGAGHTLVAQARKARPDVVLLDLGVLGQNGVRAITSLTSELPGIKVIGLGLMPSQADVLELVEAGASGFVLKDSSVKDFLQTVRTVAHGGKVLPPLLAHSLFSDVVEYALSKGKGEVRRAVRMTHREREIIALIADGLSNKAIAHRLAIATYTVKSHVHNIMEKLALHSRLQIAEHTSGEGAIPSVPPASNRS